MTRIWARYFPNFNFSKSVRLKTVTYELLLMKHSTCLLGQILAGKKNKNYAENLKCKKEEPLPSLQSRTLEKSSAQNLIEHFLQEI